MRQEKQAIKLNYLREHNIQLIMSSLYEAPMSCLELSQELGISDNGARKIIKQLEECGAVRISRRGIISRTRGNQHIRYELNGGFGYFLIFNFSYYNDKFILFDFAGNKVYESSFSYPERGGAKEDLQVLVREVKKKLVKHGFPIEKIINVTLSVSGQIDEGARCFTLSGRFRNFEKDTTGSFFKIFEKAFGAPVYAKNDVMFMLQGEMDSRADKEQTVLYAFIGRGVSAAIMYRGEIMGGNHGYAGEIGENRFGIDSTVNANAALPALRKTCREYLKTDDLNGLFDAYLEKKEVKEIVQRGAVVVGMEIANIVNLLGVKTVFIGGEALGFGSQYVQTIKDNVCKYSIMDVEVHISSEQELAVRGALLQARVKSVETILNKD